MLRQVCSYEELAEAVHSDCSAEDFDILFDQPTKKGSGRVCGCSAPGVVSSLPGRIGRGVGGRGAKEARAVEKRSLLTDVDVLVS